MEIKRTKQYIEWFNSIKDNMTRLKITARLRNVSLGNKGDVSPIGEGISEFRFHSGIRIYFIEKNKEIIILLAGSKKDNQQKVIDSVKELAKKYK